MPYFIPVEDLVGGSILSQLSVNLPGYGTPQTVIVPAVGATVYVYGRGTTAPVNVYEDPHGAGSPVTQPLTTDANGHVVDSTGNRVFVSQPQELDVSISGAGLTPRTIPGGSLADVQLLADPHVVASDAAMLAIPGAHEGTVAIRTDLNRAAFIHNGGSTGTDADWNQIAFGDVESVNGKTGIVVLTAADVGADAAGAATAALAAAAAGALTGDVSRPSTLAAPVLRDIVSIKDFGAKFDWNGTTGTDDAPAWRSCVAYVNARPSGGTATAPAGQSYINSVDANGDVIPMPTNSNGVRIQGAGFGVCVAKIGNTAKKFWDVATGYAAYSTWQNWWLLDISIDVALVTGTNNESVIGNVKNGAATLAQLNFSNVGLFRVRVTGAALGAGNFERIFTLMMMDTAAAATQLTALDIFTDLTEFVGGNIGIEIGGGISTGGGTNLNAWMDRIYLKRGYHDCGSTPTANILPYANIQLGQLAAGGFDNVIEDFYGKNSADVSIEIDSLTMCRCIRCVMEDCWTNQFLHTSFSTAGLVNAGEERIIWDRCVAIATQVLNDQGAWEAVQRNGVPLGVMELWNCSYIKRCGPGTGGSGNVGGTRSNSNGYGYAVQIGQGQGNACQMAALIIDGLKISDRNSSWTAGGQWSTYINITFPSAPTVVPVLRLRVDYTIATANTGTNYTKYGFSVAGAFTFDKQSHLTIDYTGTGDLAGFSWFTGFIGGANTSAAGHPQPTASSCSGKIGVTVKQLSGDTAPKGIQIPGQTTLTIPSILDVRDVDQAAWVGTNPHVALLSGTVNTVVTGSAQVRVTFTGDLAGQPEVGAGGTLNLSPWSGPQVATSPTTYVLPPTNSGNVSARAIPGRRYPIKGLGASATVQTGGTNKIDPGGSINATSTVITSPNSLDLMVHPNGSDWMIV